MRSDLAGGQPKVTEEPGLSGRRVVHLTKDFFRVRSFRGVERTDHDDHVELTFPESDGHVRGYVFVGEETGSGRNYDERMTQLAGFYRETGKKIGRTVSDTGEKMAAFSWTPVRGGGGPITA